MIRCVFCFCCEVLRCVIDACFLCIHMLKYALNTHIHNTQARSNELQRSNASLRQQLAVTLQQQTPQQTLPAQAHPQSQLKPHASHETAPQGLQQQHSQQQQLQMHSLSQPSPSQQQQLPDHHARLLSQEFSSEIRPATPLTQLDSNNKEGSTQQRDPSVGEGGTPPKKRGWLGWAFSPRRSQTPTPKKQNAVL